MFESFSCFLLLRRWKLSWIKIFSIELLHRRIMLWNERASGAKSIRLGIVRRGCLADNAIAEVNASWNSLNALTFWGLVEILGSYCGWAQLRQIYLLLLWLGIFEEARSVCLAEIPSRILLQISWSWSNGSLRWILRITRNMGSWRSLNWVDVSPSSFINSD